MMLRRIAPHSLRPSRASSGITDSNTRPSHQAAFARIVEPVDQQEVATA